MRLGYLLWLIAVLIGVFLGLHRYGQIDVPYITATLVANEIVALFVGLGLAVIAKLIP